MCTVFDGNVRPDELAERRYFAAQKRRRPAKGARDRPDEGRGKTGRNGRVNRVEKCTRRTGGGVGGGGGGGVGGGGGTLHPSTVGRTRGKERVRRPRAVTATGPADRLCPAHATRRVSPGDDHVCTQKCSNRVGRDDEEQRDEGDDGGAGRGRDGRLAGRARPRDGVHRVPGGGRVLPAAGARARGRGAGRAVRAPRVRLRGGGRRVRRLRGGQPADRGGRLVGAAAGGRRRGERAHRGAAAGQLPDRLRAGLGLPHGAAGRHMRRDGGPAVPVAARPRHGRHQRHQLHGVHARRAGRLRRVGAAGQRGLVVRGRAAVLQEVRGGRGRAAGRLAVPRPRRLPERGGAALEDAAGPGVLARGPRTRLRRARRPQRAAAAGLLVRAGHHGPRHPVQRVQGVPAADPSPAQPDGEQTVARHQGAGGRGHEARARRPVRPPRPRPRGVRAQGGGAQRRRAQHAAAAHAVRRRARGPPGRGGRAPGGAGPAGGPQPAGPPVHGRARVPRQPVGDHRGEPVPAPQVPGAVRAGRPRPVHHTGRRGGGRVHGHAVRGQRVRRAGHGTGVRARRAHRRHGRLAAPAARHERHVLRQRVRPVPRARRLGPGARAAPAAQPWPRHAPFHRPVPGAAVLRGLSDGRARPRDAHRGHQTGYRGERDSSISKVRVQTVAGAVPGLRARDVQVGRVLEMCHRADVHQPAPPVGHVQDGTGLGPGLGGGSAAQGARHQRPPGGRHVYHAHNTGRAHQLDGVHDRRESGRHDQGDLAQTVMCSPRHAPATTADLYRSAYRS